MKKIILLAIITFGLYSFTGISSEMNNTITAEVLSKSFTLINDTKSEVSIHTGSGFMSLNKESKTSITCDAKKEVSWTEKGKKGDVIFKITEDMCGKTIKLSSYVK